MATKRLARGALRVSYPDTHTQSPPRPRKDRDLGRPDIHPILLEALRDNDFQPVHEFQLTPKRTRALDPTPATPGRLAMELDLGGAEDAVVLVEQDGCYSWHLPADAAPGRGRARTRRLPGQAHTARFDIDLAASPTAYGPRRRRPRALPTGTRTRGLFGDLLSGVVRVVVMKFAAPVLVGQAVSFLERHVEPGLIHITDPDPTTWRRVDTLDQIPLPAGRPARILLFVHGTFSTTLSAFGGMGVTDSGRWFLRCALSRYDAVIGFDHPTLSVDPLANATDLVRRVAMVGQGVTFDVITHSRGGLTTRSFAEYVLPGSGWNGAVDKVVFVAATNAGTHLADTDRWYDLIDMTTNLTMVGAGVLAALPGGAPVAAVVSGVVKGLGALVKYLGAYAVEEGGVPGLAAMRPDGPFVTGINQTQPGQPASGTPWLVVTSNFHVTIGDDSHRPPEFPRELAMRLAEGLADRIFRGDNDLVVDCDSMGSIDAAVGGFVADTHDFGTNDAVHHVNYFVQDDLVDVLARWLDIEPAQAAAEPPPEPAPAPAPVPAPAPAPTPAPAPAPRPPRRPHRDGGQMAEPPGPDDAGAEPPQPAPAPGPAPVADEPISAHLRAELPATALVGAPAQLRVALSRKEIAAAADAVGAATTFLAVAGRPLTVQVVEKANVRIPGPATDTFELPAGGGTSELTFAVVPQAAGPVTVGVIVRDGAVPLGMLTVTATAVAKAPAGRGRQAAVAATGTLTARGDSPDLDDAIWLEVLETERDGATVLLYTVRAPRRGLLERYESPPLHDREGYVVELYRDLARLRADHGAGPAYLAGLQDRGAALFVELFPEPLRRLLWTERAHLGGLVLLTDEPYIPWELVHLRPLKGPRPKASMFLGELGLVRWQFTGYPAATLRARKGKVWALCPDYADPAYVLTETAAEASFLAQTLGAKPAKGTGREVTALLRKGGFDVLHFSGHGAADPADAAAAKLLLAGRLVRGKVAPDYLSATTVAQNADLRGPDGSGPLVVLNACQVARGGVQLSTLGGFARAFLTAGAAAYVSTLWSVGESPALDFVETLYTRLLAGDTIAAATTAARSAARAAGDATWLAYAVYARPDARLVTS